MAETTTPPDRQRLASTPVALALARITRIVGGGRDLGAVFEAFADELAGLFPYDRCSITLLDDGGRTLRVACVRDTLPRRLSDAPRPLETAPGGWAIAHRRPLIQELGAGTADRFAGDAERRAAGVVQYVVVPILGDGEAFGAFGLSSRTPGVYRAADLWVLEAIADHLGLAIAAARLRRDAERRAACAHFLAGTAALFASSLDGDRTLRTAATRAADELGDLNAVFLLDGSGLLAPREIAHPDPAVEATARDLASRQPPERGGPLLGPASAGEPVLIAALRPEQAPDSLRPWVAHLGLHSALAVPLVAGGRRLGVLLSARTRLDPRPLTGDDLGLARDFGAQVAAALLNAQLHTATERALDESEALRRLGRELAGTLDTERVLTLVSTFAQLLVGADYAAAAIEEEDGAFAWRGMVGNRTDAHRTDRIPPGRGAAGRAVAARQPVAIEGFPRNPAFPPEEFPVDAAEGMRAALAVPMVAGTRAFGALVAGYRTPRAIGPTDLRLAAALADQAAIALENARLFREAQRAIAERDAFLGVASHELRTPLTTLKGRAQLLQRRLDPTRQPQESASLQVMLRQIEELVRIVDDLLVAAHPGDGGLPLTPEPVELVGLVRRVAAESELDERRVVRVQAEAEALVGRWDPWRLEQVLANLIANARRYSADGEPVTVRVRRAGAEARVEVVDRGVGIAAEDLDRIFDRFYRGDQIRAGIGLGLAVARRIVADHGGRLWADSAGPGRGATFVVALPLAGPAG